LETEVYVSFVPVQAGSIVELEVGEMLPFHARHGRDFEVRCLRSAAYQPNSPSMEKPHQHVENANRECSS
jgi:hypothetical protein